jgi:hypothetical protein
LPPKIWTASVVMRMAASVAKHLAKDENFDAWRPWSSIQALWRVSSRAASVSLAMSASMNCTAWKPPIGAPKALRSRA